MPELPPVADIETTLALARHSIDAVHNILGCCHILAPKLWMPSRDGKTTYVNGIEARYEITEADALRMIEKWFSATEIADESYLFGTNVRGLVQQIHKLYRIGAQEGVVFSKGMSLGKMLRALCRVSDGVIKSSWGPTYPTAHDAAISMARNALMGFGYTGVLWADNPPKEFNGISLTSEFIRGERVVEIYRFLKNSENDFCRRFGKVDVTELAAKVELESGRLRAQAEAQTTSATELVRTVLSATPSGLIPPDPIASAISMIPTTIKNARRINAEAIIKKIGEVGHPLSGEEIADKIFGRERTGDIGQLLVDLVSAGALKSKMKIGPHRGYGLPAWDAGPAK